MALCTCMIWTAFSSLKLTSNHYYCVYSVVRCACWTSGWCCHWYFVTGSSRWCCGVCHLQRRQKEMEKKVICVTILQSCLIVVFLYLFGNEIIILFILRTNCMLVNGEKIHTYNAFKTIFSNKFWHVCLNVIFFKKIDACTYTIREL